MWRVRLDVIGGFATMRNAVADNVPVSLYREAVQDALGEGHDVIEPAKCSLCQNSTYNIPHMPALNTLPFTTYSLTLWLY
jgi:hypothetical protein